MSQLPRRDLEGLVSIDEISFRWRVYREPQWSTAHGWKGLAISVALAKNPSRELVLEFPFKVKSRKSTPSRQRPRISEKEIETHIRSALDAGWNPESRGKAFVFEIQGVESK